MPDDLDIIDAATKSDEKYEADPPAQQPQVEGQEENNEAVQAEQSVDVQQPAQPRQVEVPPAQQPVVPGRVPAVDPNNPLNLKRVGAQFADGKGNIVDKDGKVLAKAGGEARLWQEASRANAQVRNLTRERDNLMRERERNTAVLENARKIAEMPQRLGVTKEDFNEGITLMGRWKADPVGVAREIVARTLTFGYNVTDILGKNAGDALEMKAITQLVNQTTAPMRQQQEHAAAQQQNMARAEEQYTAFVAKYPDAELHAEAIANLMNNSKVNAEVAYYQVKSFALENGLDFTQPLGPQIAARRAGQQAPEPHGQQQRIQRAPMHVASGRGSEAQLTNQQEQANAGDDWGDILSSVLRKGG